MRSNEEIVAAFQGGDPEAIEELWLQNERGVQYVADKLAAAGLGEAEDLKQEGFFGLRRAAELYDPAEGVPFMSYAWYWIRQAMYSSIRNTGAAIRIPVHMREKLTRYRRFMAEYRQSTGGAWPEDAFIRAKLEISQGELETIREALQLLTVASLDGPAGDPDGEITLGDTVAAEGDFAEDVDRALDHERMVRELDRIMDKMNPRRRDAVKARFFEHKTLDTFGSASAREGLRELRRRGRGGQLERYYIDYLSSAAYKGGLAYFRQKGCSVTEAQAIRNVSLKEKREKMMQEFWEENAELQAILRERKEGKVSK